MGLKLLTALKMNKILAATIRFLNGFLALFLVVIGGVLGRQYGLMIGLHGNGLDASTGAVIGVIGGFVAAVVICGFLALFIEMRSELIRIREVLEKTAN